MLLFIVGTMVGPGVSAQESQKTWRISDPEGQTEIYNTQQEAVAAFVTLPVPHPIYEGAYHYVDKIKDTEISENGDITLTYWMGKEQPLDPDWIYSSQISLIGHATEQEAVSEYIGFLNEQNPACPPAATLTPAGDWGPLSDLPEYAGKVESRSYSTTIVIGDNTAQSPCQPADFGESLLTRQRRLQCPNPYTEWKDEHQACVNEEIIAKITTKTEECDAGGGASGLVGNPCNIKTGEKYETESDVDLGWVALERYYHSGGSSMSGGFGQGWTHSHDTRLSLSANAVGLIDGSGFHVRFRKIGTDYIAADSTGDRLVLDGSAWKLYRANAVFLFDANGRLTERHAENGVVLTYAYDAYGRLGVVTHSSGRALTFHYDGTSGEARITHLTSAGTTLASYTYTATGQVETVAYPGGDTRTYHYEDTRFPGHLTGITAEDDLRYSTFAYDIKGRVISSQHEDGAAGVVLTYTGQGGAIVTDALGHQTSYGLTGTPASGTPRKVGDIVDSRGTISQTYYDESVDFRRRLDTVTDRSGTQTKHIYAESTDAVTGLPVSIHLTTEAVGLPQERVNQEHRELASNRVLLTQVGSRETRITRNERLQPTSITVRDTGSNAARTTSYAYCEASDVAASSSTCPILGFLKSVDGPRIDVADITSYLYYPNDDAGCAAAPAACAYRKGDLWKITNALGQTEEVLQYDDLGRVLSARDANGVVTDYEYHPRGWLIAIKQRGPDAGSETDDRITYIAYEPTGLLQRITPPDGSYIDFDYGAAQRMTGIADNAGNTIRYTLDLAGNRLQEDTKDAGGTLRRTLSRVYNPLGQLTSQADAYANATSFTYDVNGNLNLTTDPLGRASDNNHDPLNRLVSTLQDAGGINADTSFAYDALDNLTSVTDPKDLNTTYAYNGFGEVIQQSSPDTGLTSFGYDNAGNLASRLDANDSEPHSYTYDALNRPVAVTYFAATGPGIEYGYDAINPACATGETFAKGRLTSLHTGGAEVHYCYDRFGNMVRKLQTTNGLALMLQYAYTPTGQVQSITYPDGTVVDYVRNAQGRTTEVGVTAANDVRTVLLNQAGYAPFGPVVGWVYGNGRSLLRSYNQNYQPETIFENANGGLSLHYGFDAAGQLTELKDGLQSAFLARYDYDGLGRLSILRDGPTATPLETYGYDAAGNRTSLLHAGVTTPYTYAADSHRLTSVGGIARSYDGAGNTTAIGGTAREFVYNPADRLSQVKQGGVVTASYVYNALGERVVASTGGVSTHTVYDEVGRWLGDYDNTGAPLQQVVWLDDLPVGLLAGAGAGQALHYVEPDHLGTPRAVIDRTRDVAIWTWDAKSEAFGNSAPNQDPDLDGTAFVFNLRFPGQRYDAATGLNYNYFRDYDPASGRYVQSDPIGLRGGINTYAYVGGNPASRTDPRGLATTIIINGNVHLSDPFSWFGKHAGIHVDHGSGGQPQLYDPSGSYRPEVRGSGGVFDGDDASLESYIRFQKIDGSSVRIYVFDTTPEQEREISARWPQANNDLVDPRGANCATEVSSSISGIGPFKDVSPARTPFGLEGQINRIGPK